MSDQLNTKYKFYDCGLKFFCMDIEHYMDIIFIVFS